MQTDYSGNSKVLTMTVLAPVAANSQEYRVSKFDITDMSMESLSNLHKGNIGVPASKIVKSFNEIKDDVFIIVDSVRRARLVTRDTGDYDPDEEEPYYIQTVDNLIERLGLGKRAKDFSASKVMYFIAGVEEWCHITFSKNLANYKITGDSDAN